MIIDIRIKIEARLYLSVGTVPYISKFQFCSNLCTLLYLFPGYPLTTRFWWMTWNSSPPLRSVTTNLLSSGNPSPSTISQLPGDNDNTQQ